jgi:hypothetical protein
MDIATITGGIAAAKGAIDLIKNGKDLVSKSENSDAIHKINEAEKNVSTALQAIYDLQTELFRLQDENRQLKDKLKEGNDWQARINNYALEQTPGGATVYASTGDQAKHYICPSCTEKKEIHILQDRHVYTGDYICPSCKATYPVKTKKSGVGSVRVERC